VFIGLGVAGGMINVGCWGWARCFGAIGGEYVGDADKGIMGGKLSRRNGSAMTAEIAAGRRGEEGLIAEVMSCDAVSCERGPWFTMRERPFRSSGDFIS